MSPERPAHEDLTVDDWAAQVGTEFAMDIDGSRVTVTLTEVQRHPRRDHGVRREPFSLVFSAPEGTSAPQRMYDFVHDVLGTTTIFVVPIGRGHDATVLYEAVFN